MPNPEETVKGPPRVPRLHQSIANVLISKSPLHAWQKHRLFGDTPDEPTAAKDFGSLIDGLILGGGGKVAIIEAADFRTKAAQQARDEARAGGMIPVLADAWAETQGVALAIRSQLARKGFVFDPAKSFHKVRVEWTEPAFGVECGGELDCFDEASATVWDLKVTKDASPDSIALSMKKYGYHIQHAAYTQAVETLHPELAGRARMLFLFCEAVPPFDVVIARPAGTMRQLGAYQWERACRTWRDCLASGVWPGYSDGIVDIEARPWMMTEEMERGDHEFEL